MKIITILSKIGTCVDIPIQCGISNAGPSLHWTDCAPSFVDSCDRDVQELADRHLVVRNALDKTVVGEID